MLCERNIKGVLKKEMMSFCRLKAGGSRNIIMYELWLGWNRGLEVTGNKLIFASRRSIKSRYLHACMAKINSSSDSFI